MDTIIATLLKIVFILGLLVTGFAYMTLAERKIVARIQTRYGPNRAGPFGLLASSSCSRKTSCPWPPISWCISWPP